MAEDKKQARQWGMACHLAALIGFVGVPFGHVLGPLVVWLIKKAEDPFIDQQGKEALNFQLSMTVYGLVAGLLVFIIIGFPLLIGLAIADVVLIIVAAVKISNGEDFKYPAVIKFLK